MSLFAAWLAMAVLGAEPGHDHHPPQLGSLKFETTCSPAAQPLFERGLGWLHSFGYAEAERSFAEAAAADPDCAIAHWGEAMSNYHPLWAPPTAAELAKGSIAVAKARAAAAKSQRERDYVAATAAFYGNAATLDHKTRALAYSVAMGELHRRYPADDEAAVFYALSLAAAGTMDEDPTFAKEHEAAKILNRILADNPNHPGVAHYLIHSFDYPPLAHLAVPAARRYAKIAPDSPHAQHMPSHIFVRLGLWQDAISSNVASEASARAMAKAQGLADSSSERLHAMDYLAYAYLQTAQDAKADQVLRDLDSIRRADPPIFTVAYAATAIPARIVLERRQWRAAAALELAANVRGLAPLDTYQWADAHIHFARAVGAARSGDAAAARSEVEKLRAIETGLTVPAGSYDWRKPVAIERQIAEAWTVQADGRGDEALRIMGAAADLDDATEKHPVTPGAILPAREQLGELLLEMGRPRDALRQFEAALVRAPRRLAGVYGAAHSAKLVGDAAKAKTYFAELNDITRAGEAERSEVREARQYASELASR
jgi:tetratricopeptide (TPR) repeat protein